MPFFNLSRSSTRTVDSNLADNANSLHYVPSNTSGSLALKPTVSGMKAELLDEDDQAWGSAPASHHHGKRFHVPHLGSKKSSGSS